MEKFIVGEDQESSEEEFDRSESLSLASQRSGKVQGGNDSVVSGEDPESDIDPEDFGSTVSLTSSVESAKLTGKPTADIKTFPKVPEKIPTPAERLKERNPALYKKHYERNKALRTNICDKFLHPVINQNIRKMDKLSQNLSNSQMQMQEALLQSRLTTTHLLQLQKQLENFVQKDYLSDVKILPKSSKSDTAK